MKTRLQDQQETKEQNQTTRVIRVAVLAEEPLGWGSGKHFFPVILHGYTWTSNQTTYTIETCYVFDKDILQGRLNRKEFDVVLMPGGGVGDGEAVMKGFRFSRKVNRWKKNIASFIKQGGGYVGICGGTALITSLQTAQKKPRTFFERQYHRSSLGITSVTSFYRSFAFPLFYPFQRNHPEDIGASAYVFSFAPGVTRDGARVHSGGVPIDVTVCENHPIFEGMAQQKVRLRWWGGPALVVPENPGREVRILARYPSEEFSENKDIRIHAWQYIGGIRGLLAAFIKSARFIKKQHESLKNLFLYTYYMAGDWRRTEQLIRLDYANKPCITTEVYPNEQKARIVLCTGHPEYLVWWGGRIREMTDQGFHCLGEGLYQWQDINPLSTNAFKEMSHTWWMVRRFVAWAAQVPDADLPCIKPETCDEKALMLLENIFWDGTLRNQMLNI